MMLMRPRAAQPQTIPEAYARLQLRLQSGQFKDARTCVKDKAPGCDVLCHAVRAEGLCAVDLI